mmetsp:Transcript_65290/g.120262  ORF Transcript_65290/g.120262 Transcript_65290/m.120262 type:complete len:218 (+) Transcript_65290:47-700(+)
MHACTKGKASSLERPRRERGRNFIETHGHGLAPATFSTRGRHSCRQGAAPCVQGRARDADCTGIPARLQSVCALCRGAFGPCVRDYSPPAQLLHVSFAGCVLPERMCSRPTVNCLNAVRLLTAGRCFGCKPGPRGLDDSSATGCGLRACIAERRRALSCSLVRRCWSACGRTRAAQLFGLHGCCTDVQASAGKAFDQKLHKGCLAHSLCWVATMLLT